MKKVFILKLLIVLTLLVLGCSKTEDPVDDPINGDDPNDWKVQYDIMDTSPLYSQDVSSCYQIFPIAWADSSGNGFGDLRGIIENVDYLADVLNVNCVWLNPINPSPYYHKYDVTDYYGIDHQFGTMADFEELIDVLTDNNIIFIMDLVINHTSDAHPWFINSRLGDGRTYRDWYVWNTLEDRVAFPSTTGWYRYNEAYYYASFWSKMPELNFDNPDVRQEIKTILEFWLDKGVGGFRIDAARHIYDLNEYPRGTNILRENIDYFREFNYHVKSINPNAIVLGEVWAPTNIVRGFYEGMDATFNFDLSVMMIDALKMGTHQNLVSSLVTMHQQYANVREDFIDSIFLTNHDQNRIMNEVGMNMDKMRLAAHMLFTMPGVSWIYYGEELGMSGVKPDESIRQPFNWGLDSSYTTQSKPNGIHAWDTYNQSLAGVSEQLDDPESLLRLYIDLIALKNHHEILRFGSIEAVGTSDNRILTYIREHEGQRYLVIHNLSGLERNVSHNLSNYEMVYHTHIFSGNETEFTILPYQSIILSVNQTSVNLGSVN